jgi:hypothetical protein
MGSFMGIRETIQEKRGLTTSVAVGLIVVAALVGGWYALRGEDSAHRGAGEKNFFSDDDGKTAFVDSSNQIPPFMHNGKVANGCTVFSHDGGKTKIVGWLFRYTDEGKNRLQMQKTSKGIPGPSPLECIEIKKPGAPEDAWVNTNLPRASEIRIVPGSPNQPAAPLRPE